MSSIPNICEAIATDVEANVTLPEHNRWLYLSPPVIRADTRPTLCVYVSDSDFELNQTEDNYLDSHVLVVEWYESAARVVDGGGTNGEALALAALERSEAIIDHLRTFAAGLPAPVVGQSEGTLQSAKYGLTEGMTWLCRVEFKVSRWN